MRHPVTIIGGGVIGLCCAYYLQKQGYRITVIEKGDITSGTSFGNAGYISPSHIVPLASPGIVARGMRWMMSSSSPFYIKPRLDLDLLRWGINFYKKANHATVAKNAPHLAKILLLSRELTSDIKNDLGNHFRMEEKGCLMLFKSAATGQHEIELSREAAAYGIDTKMLSAAEVQALEPDVEVNVKGGVLYPVDCHLHPGDFMRTLKDHLTRNGVNLMLNTEVKGFEKLGNRVTSVITDKGAIETGELVLAAGSWLPAIAAKLGIHLLLQAGKGYSITYDNMKHNLRYPAILVDDRVAMTPMGADLRMGGTMEISGINKTVMLKRVQSIFRAAKNYYPTLDVEFPKTDRIWSGLRPLTPDGLPYIGRHTKYGNLTIAGGHAMLGLSLAAATGKLVEEIVGYRNTSLDIMAFDVERYK
jgi:D-amino-acid dehydrogenase